MRVLIQSCQSMARQFKFNELESFTMLYVKGSLMG